MKLRLHCNFRHGPRHFFPLHLALNEHARGFRLAVFSQFKGERTTLIHTNTCYFYLTLAFFLCIAVFGMTWFRSPGVRNGQSWKFMAKINLFMPSLLLSRYLWFFFHYEAAQGDNCLLYIYVLYSFYMFKNSSV